MQLFDRDKRANAWAKLGPFVPLALATLALATITTTRVVSRVGHAGPTLDDAYIHFQYARAFAEGHPLRYQASAPISTGATSLLWPLVLSVPYVLGLHADALVWAAWALSYAALFGLGYEAFRLTAPLAGRTAAIGASAMTLTFGGLAWCAASGMEVVPFAWLIAHATRRAAEWSEARSEGRSLRAFGALLGFAILAPLARPEGALTSLVLGVAVTLFPARKTTTSRSLGLLFAASAVFPNLLLFALTKSATSNTAHVKLLFGNPYYDFGTAFVANAKLLVSSILDGGPWSAEFLPKGGAIVALSGLVALAFRGHAARRHFRALAILVLALTIFVPCTYVTFLWNRLRYLWPFAMPWFIGLACLARVIGGLLARFDERAAKITTALLAGGVAGLFATKLDGVITDVAQSASGIARQQAALGRWAKRHLPSHARIGVNDTGAIAYFSDAETFDIVGLTTPSEGRYWVSGPASRFEHYERLANDAPNVLPTHFIVYPEWMGCSAVLGTPLQEAVVNDATILGGHTMRAYEARWDLLGSGRLPWTTTGPIVDEVDVADLESEHDHGYALLFARDGEQVVGHHLSPRGDDVVDGGRTNRSFERFTARLPRGRDLVAIGRVASATPTTLRLMGERGELGRATVQPGHWQEVTFLMPAESRDQAPQKLEIIAEGGVFASFHWWFAEPATATPQ